jgi:hypothetical protein
LFPQKGTWAEIENILCNAQRDKPRAPLILIDLQRSIFEDHGFEVEVFADHFRVGVWADLIRNGGRVALVIGTQQNVCVCDKLELLDAMADVCDGSEAIRITATTDQAVRWLTCSAADAAA